jgi:hypothetical protein
MSDVKALVQIGLMKKPRWIHGKLVSRDQTQSVVDIHGENHTLENHVVKMWRKINLTAIENFAVKNWADLRQVVRSAAENFLPNVDKLVFDEENKIITYQDVSIGPTSVERESIAAFIEVPAWSVSYYKHIPATFHEPEDVDEVSCGSSENNVGAARLFIDTILRLEADCYWESVSYSCLPEYDY